VSSALASGAFPPPSNGRERTLQKKEEILEKEEIGRRRFGKSDPDESASR
jgi:hypothetical protein